MASLDENRPSKKGKIEAPDPDAALRVVLGVKEMQELTELRAKSRANEKNLEMGLVKLGKTGYCIFEDDVIMDNFFELVENRVKTLIKQYDNITRKIIVEEDVEEDERKDSYIDCLRDHRMKAAQCILKLKLYLDHESDFHSEAFYESNDLWEESGQTQAEAIILY